MPLLLRNVRYQAGDLLVDADLSFENPAVVAFTGSEDAGLTELFGLISGDLRPQSGSIEGFRQALAATASFTSANPAEVRESIERALDSDADLILVGPSLALTDPVFRHRAITLLQDLRRRGRWVLLVSQDLDFLERHCDEVVVMDDGSIVERGDPTETLTRYRTLLLDRYKSESNSEVGPLARHGDERARVESVQIQDASGQQVQVVQSGESTTVRVVIEFQANVEQPVIGILIRSRVGINVYGTNTEAENVDLGPCKAGDRVEGLFRFDCNLCAEQYTLTVASHDPDGLAHDWLEEAIFFTVADTRYTAGVANLRAAVEVRKPSPR
jgi:lipopolysaccharide transport system ATP-binding protein